jgi:hypothetical protein
MDGRVIGTIYSVILMDGETKVNVKLDDWGLARGNGIIRGPSFLLPPSDGGPHSVTLNLTTFLSFDRHKIL